MQYGYGRLTVGQEMWLRKNIFIKMYVVLNSSPGALRSFGTVMWNVM